VQAGTQSHVSMDVGASPDALYDLVSDVTRMGEWSPETRRCRWLDGATGPAVGARFKGTNRRGIVRWSTKPRVVVADPGREFSFAIPHGGRDLTQWTFRFEPRGDGTAVTESFVMLEAQPWYFSFGERLIGLRDRKGDLEAGMTATLTRLKAAAEGGAAP
jgi:Polyketide cyclase / dehydrase and lipid transport